MKDFCDQKKYMLIAAVIGVIAAFMPWASISGFMNSSFSGIDGDGKLTVVLFLVAGYFAFKGNKGEELSGTNLYVAAGAFAIAGLIGLYDWSNLSEKLKAINEVGSKLGGKKKILEVKIGFGLYLTAIAGVAGAVLPFVLKNKQKKAVSIEGNIEGNE